MKVLSINILTLICCIGTLQTFSQTQDDHRTFSYGINLSWIFPGNTEAQMYECGKESSVNLSQILISNSTNYTKIKDYYNDDFSLYELPHDITYKSTIRIGGRINYAITQFFTTFFNVNYYSPRITHSNFSIKLASKKSAYGDDVIQQGTIAAKENRLDMVLGLQKVFNLQKEILPYAEFAIVGSYLKMKTHEISIGPLTQSVVAYSNSDANTTFSKFGYGASLSIGAQIPKLLNYSIAVGLTLSALRYGIVDNELSFGKSIDCIIIL